MANQNKTSFQITMEVEKETKGAIRYAEVKENDLAEAIIGTLYIRKSAFAGLGLKTWPESIKVTITV